jgi:hypothetical protein
MASIQLTRHEAEEGDLPDACMCCGEPATEKKRLRFTSHPLWVYILLPFGWIPYAIVAWMLTERVRCYTLFCPRHKSYWRGRALLVWAGFGLMWLAIVAIPVTVSLILGLIGQFDDAAERLVAGFACVNSILMIVCWLASIPIIQLASIHPAEVKETRLTLKCISPAFAEAVREYREDHKGKRERAARLPQED